MDVKYLLSMEKVQEKSTTVDRINGKIQNSKKLTESKDKHLIRLEGTMAEMLWV